MNINLREKIRKHPLRYRIFATLISLLLVAGMIPVTVFAQASGSGGSDLLGLDSIKPSNFDATINPYGYEVNTPFLMSACNELQIYMTYGSNTDNPFYSKREYYRWNPGKVQSYISQGNLRVDSIDKEVNNSTGFMGYTRMQSNTAPNASFMQAVAFDATGSGRKTHVAYIGYDNARKKIITWVTLANDNKLQGQVFEIDTASWMDDAVQQYNANNFFAITAGHYGKQESNMVGMETYVVYYVGDKGPKLHEFRLNGTVLQTFGSTDASNLLHKDYKGSKLGDSNDPRDQLFASLATGDFNGDNRDDLAVLSYVSKPSKSTGNLPASLFAPQLSVAYGGVGLSATTRSFLNNPGTVIQSESVRKDVTNTNLAQKKLYSTFYSPSVTAGDIDGNGLDEIVIAGYAAETVTKSMTSELTETAYSFKNKIDDKDNDKYNIATAAVYNADGQLACRSFENFNLKTQYDGENGILNLYTAATFRFFRNRLSNEPNYEFSIAPSFTVQCVAVNGANNAEQIFFNGTMCTYENGIKALYTPAVFNAISTQDQPSLRYFLYEKGDGSENSIFGYEMTLSLTSGMPSFPFFQSTAVGVYDNNGLGREQIAFSLGIKLRSEDDYYYSLGMMGGCDYTDTKDSKGNILTAGTAGNRYCSMNKIEIYAGLINKTCNINKKGDNLNEKLNCLVVCTDSRKDGVVARYKGAEYAYTSPEIVTVLQAAPYFEELGTNSNNSTTYSISHTYALKTTSTQSSSSSIGFSAEVQAQGFKASLNTGKTNGWTKSFEEEASTSYTYSFSATSQNQVVVQRTPVFMYAYDIQDENGNWIDGGADGSLQIAIPQKPIYSSLNVVEYNDFADSYNDRLTTEWGKLDEDKRPEIETLEKDKLLLITDSTLRNNEGNPYAYRSDWGGTGSKALMTSSIALDYSDGVKTFNYGETLSKSEGGEKSSGFYFDSTVMAGGGAFGFEAWGGVSAGTESSTSKGKYKTTITGSECSGTVGDLDQSKYDVNVKDYGFNWNFGSWELKLTNHGNTTAYGYALSNLKSGNSRPKNLTATDVPGNTSQIAFTWDQAADSNGYNLYLLGDNGTYAKINSELITGTTYTYTIPTGNRQPSFTFVVTGYNTNTGKETIYSNTAVYYRQVSGQSAYELACANGFVGSEADWLASLIGQAGQNGVGISSVQLEDGSLSVILTNNTVIHVGNVKGETGEDGVGIAGISINENGELVIKLTDGTESNYGKVVGKDGLTPFIGTNGNWWIGDTDTGVAAAGADGKSPYIGANGHWFIGDTDTGVNAAGKDGQDGEDGLTPYIGDNGNWWIGDTDTYVPATGAEGQTPVIGDNGNWWIGDEDTGIKAVGTDGQNGQNGQDGLTPFIGDNGNWWIGDEDTGIKAAGTSGQDGQTPVIGDNGNWWIGNTDTNIPSGTAGTDGNNGKDGVGITGIEIDADGYLLVTLTDGSVINAGKLNNTSGDAAAQTTGKITVEVITLQSEVTALKQQLEEEAKKDGTIETVAGTGLAVASVSFTGNLASLIVYVFKKRLLHF